MRGGHVNRIGGLTYSPDGTRFASTGNDDTTLKFWNTTTGHLLKTVPIFGDRPGSVDWSPDGETVAVAGDGGTIYLYDAGGSLLRQWQGHTVGTSDIQFANNSQVVVTSGYDGKVKLWDAAIGSLLGTISTAFQYTYGFDISPDGQTLVVAMEGSNAQVWNLTTLTKIATLTGFNNGTVDADISPNGQYVAVTGGNSTFVKIYNAGTWSLFRTITPDSFDTVLCEFAPDSKTIVTNGFRGTYCFTVATGGRLWYNDYIGEALDIRPDGEQVLSGTSGFEALNYVNLTDAKTGLLQSTVSVSDAPASAVTFSPDSAKVAMGTEAFDSKLTVFRRGDGSKVFTNEYSSVSNGVRDVRFSPDGGRVAAAGGKGYTKVFDSTTGAQLLLLDDGLTSPVTVGGVDFSPNGQLIGTITDARWVSLWDAGSGQLLSRFTLTGVPGFALRFAPSGNELVLGVNTMLQVRDLSGRTLRLFAFNDAVGRVAVSRDGSLVAAASQDGTARVFRYETFAPVSPFLVHSGPVNGLAFSPDGKRIVTGSSDATVKVWSVTGALLAKYDVETGQPGGYEGVNDVAWSSDGKTISYVRGDGTLVSIAAPLAKAPRGSSQVPR